MLSLTLTLLRCLGLSSQDLSLVLLGLESLCDIGKCRMSCGWNKIASYLHAGKLHLHQLELDLLELVLVHGVERVETHAVHRHCLLLLVLEAVRYAINSGGDGRLMSAVVVDVEVLGHHAREFIFLLGGKEVVFLLGSDDTGYVEGAGRGCGMRNVWDRARGGADTSGAQTSEKRRARVGSRSGGHIVIKDRGIYESLWFR